MTLCLIFLSSLRSHLNRRVSSCIFCSFGRHSAFSLPLFFLLVCQFLFSSNHIYIHVWWLIILPFQFCESINGSFVQIRSGSQHTHTHTLQSTSYLRFHFWPCFFVCSTYRRLYSSEKRLGDKSIQIEINHFLSICIIPIMRFVSLSFPVEKKFNSLKFFFIL